MWRLTLRDVYDLLDAEETRARREDYRAGVLAAAVFNASPARRKGAKGLKPADFFPNLRQRKPLPDKLELRKKLRKFLGGGRGEERTDR